MLWQFTLTSVLVRKVRGFLLKGSGSRVIAAAIRGGCRLVVKAVGLVIVIWKVASLAAGGAAGWNLVFTSEIPTDSS